MSSNAEFGGAFEVPVSVLEYRDIAGHEARVRPGSSRHPDPVETELAQRVVEERAAAVREMELRLRQEYEQKLAAARRSVADAILDFGQQRNDYFAHVEAEIVQLSLSIAAKILHREAQVDPMLMATLVRIAIEKMREGTDVTVHVHPACVASWRQYFAAQPNLAAVAVVEDAKLTEHDCILETELGTTNFGLDTQLKEVEQGFFDLLALRPVGR